VAAPLIVALEPWFDYVDALVGYQFVSAELGPDRDLHVLGVASTAEYRESRQGASFPRVTSDKPNDFVIVHFNGYQARRTEIHAVQFNFGHVQPLKDELLLVCGRSRYRGADDYDLNAHVYNHEGQFLRDFLLGDGIQDVQTTHDGHIWTSYFDEGVFGNFGWNEPIGHDGLIRWSTEGKRLWGFGGAPGFSMIADCYALNVISDEEAWCCYYTDFPLVKLQGAQVAATWPSPISGAGHFAVWKDSVLMDGGYHAHDKFVLLKLGDREKITVQQEYTFADEMSGALSATYSARGEYLLLGNGTVLYRADLKQLVQK
jgi:hypothetical protein